MTIEKVLNNGVIKHVLEVENNFYESQKMLDLASVTENIDSESAYNERVFFKGLGTYEIKVERQDDYNRFMRRFNEEKNHARKDYEAKRRDIHNKYYDDIYTRSEAIALLDELDKNFYDNDTCTCKLCSFPIISFEEWKTGKLEKGVKVGKAMRKAGFSQSLIDFYSVQIKTEKSVYLTISDKVQHITGMANYAENDSWDGYNGTSCQDTRHDTDMCINLGGSLWDNKLFIGMLHDSLEDLEDMTDKLKARVLFRLVHIDGEACLISTTYYGNNKTKDELHNALLKLEGENIFSRNVKEGCTDRIKESANGFFELYHSFDIHVSIDDYYDIEIECPVCCGSGDFEAYCSNRDYYYDIKCPACDGDGEYSTSIYIEVDEWMEVEEEDTIEPYAEGYSHYGNFIHMRVNLEYIRSARSESEASEMSITVNDSVNDIIDLLDL